MHEGFRILRPLCAHVIHYVSPFRAPSKLNAIGVACRHVAKDKYYLYVDDSGWRYPEHENASREDGMDYFALGGILVKGSDRDEFIDKFATFRLKWGIDYPLHSTEIRGRRRKFLWLMDDKQNEQFNKDLLALLCDLPVVGFASVIDRVGYNTRYKEKYQGKPWWMCKTAFAILVERVSKFVGEKGFRFKIIVEQCAKKEDEAIVEYFRALRKDGPPFNTETSSKYGKIGRELFQQIPFGDPEFQTKKSPFLQIADLYLYAMVKGGYDDKYLPYRVLMERGKLVDAIIPPEKVVTHGIKYSCFDPR